jgi:7,8-dihydropterin-6-yl-methyl-4-(beta-D-ribofuranosyl)aminobenzene 5'-phosphate synthase
MRRTRIHLRAFTFVPIAFTFVPIAFTFVLIAVTFVPTAFTFVLNAAPARPSTFVLRADRPRVRTLRILILSTMLADQGVGEWGFAALVEVDGQRILFDTGARPDTVLANARELKVDLSGVTDVILSHNHDDHTGGLLTLRRELAKTNPQSLMRAHVGKGIFWSRPSETAGGERNGLLGVKADYEAAGGAFLENEGPQSIRPGVWLTGPIPRIHPERNWSGRGMVKTGQGLVEDTIPEDQSLVFDTDDGLVLLSGCGHAGVVNTLEYARTIVRPAPVLAAIGGFHLFRATDEQLDWTAEKLRGFGLRNLMGAHCTGIEAVYGLRQRLGLRRGACVVGAVGASFELGKGLDPLELAR